MSEVPLPVRQKQKRGQCRCLAIENGREIPCDNLAMPDGPFCGNCVDRHESWDEKGYVITAW